MRIKDNQKYILNLNLIKTNNFSMKISNLNFK